LTSPAKLGVEEYKGGRVEENRKGEQAELAGDTGETRV